MSYLLDNCHWLCWNVLSTDLLHASTSDFFFKKIIYIIFNSTSIVQKLKREEQKRLAQSFHWSAWGRVQQTSDVFLDLDFACSPWLCSDKAAAWLMTKSSSQWLQTAPPGTGPCRHHDSEPLMQAILLHFLLTPGIRYTLLTSCVIQLLHAHPWQSCCSQWQQEWGQIFTFIMSLCTPSKWAHSPISVFGTLVWWSYLWKR